MKIDLHNENAKHLAGANAGGYVFDFIKLTSEYGSVEGISLKDLCHKCSAFTRLDAGEIRHIKKTVFMEEANLSLKSWK